MAARLRHVWLALSTLPRLARDARWRRLFADMRALCRRLPRALDAPLLEALAALAPAQADVPLPEADVRRLADLAALLERRSPLGLCLRRSLLRYHFLRRAGVPVALNFGARLIGGAADRDVAGHAWTTLHGQPYFEDDENYRGFALMIHHPPPLAPGAAAHGIGELDDAE